MHLQSLAQLSPRCSELRAFSPALGRETTLRVLTPGEGAHGASPLPVLYLLHGGGPDSDHASWTDEGGAEALTAGLPLVVVMPDGGKGGWYTDWRTVGTRDGAQRWETHHVHELLPFIQSRYGTRTDRAGTAVAGLSMGGFGAVHYAARHPDLFGFAASFSGAVDVLHRGIARVVRVSPLIMGGVRNDILGDLEQDEAPWRAVNPVDLAGNLATVELQLRTGDGRPGGPHGGDPRAADEQEVGVSQATGTLHERLAELGIGHVYDAYGAGTHTWPYWQDALQATLPRVLGVAEERRPAPATVDHLAWEPAFSVWGHDVLLDRQTLEPAVLSVRPGGFSLRASGTGVVTTPALHAPGQPVPVTIAGRGGTAPTTAEADAAGRLVVPVDLGRDGREREVDVSFEAEGVRTR